MMKTVAVCTIKRADSCTTKALGRARVLTGQTIWSSVVTTWIGEIYS
ncbi:hypothetical protein OAS89_02570 [Alphaproteobacteria bacterium]|nr:hypothetical protein [Alphaproteobacteria bacterium]